MKKKSLARCLMIQGTSSHAGKSVLVAALCRIFAQDGWRVAPFKSQNMSLNSFVTPEGGEMGRAQVLQAQAAGIPPHTDMNPILLKPTSERGAQVILNGKVVGHLEAEDYHQVKFDLWPHARAALERLRSTYQVVILEGAGSPAEVNLKERDIVNMHVAKVAEAPVLLVGDIDRGGVFASLVGTLELLEPWERKLVAGLVINKFRGAQELLTKGLEFLARKTGKPVLGVIPYIRNLSLEEEDTVNLDERLDSASEKDHLNSLDLVVIRLPYISNATDFQPLEKEAGVRVRYVEDTGRLGVPDCVFLPGSKSVGSDLSFMRRSGLAAAVMRLAVNGVPVVGICGGYQILGRSIDDPEGVEFGPSRIEGLGLLPVDTVMAREKSTHQVKAVAKMEVPWLGLRTGCTPIVGYEIHMGISRVDGDAPLLILERDGKRVRVEDGAIHEELPVFGCYLHGLFENPALRRDFLNYLRRRRGLGFMYGLEDWDSVRERNLDRLAEVVRDSLDLERIYSLIGLRAHEVGK
jgi:adenosylcobyric acid synthase